MLNKIEMLREVVLFAKGRSHEAWESVGTALGGKQYYKMASWGRPLVKSNTTK